VTILDTCHALVIYTELKRLVTVSALSTTMPQLNHTTVFH